MNLNALRQRFSPVLPAGAGPAGGGSWVQEAGSLHESLDNGIAQPPRMGTAGGKRVGKGAEKRSRPWSRCQARKD